MKKDKMSLSQSIQERSKKVLAIQEMYQKTDEAYKEDFIVQVAQRAQEEWETFHLEYPDVDEERFVEAQSFCLRQWLLHYGITLADLPAFEEAEKRFEYEIRERTAEIRETTSIMDNPLYQEALSLGIIITTQAEERSERVRKAMNELRNKTASYLAGKINQFRASEQAQEREKEAQNRLEEVRQESEYLKTLGIIIEYEDQKVALQKREKVLREHMSTLGRQLAKSQYCIDTTKYISRCEEDIRLFNVFLENIHLKNLNVSRMHNDMKSVISDWDTARQQAQHARDQVETLQESIREIQESVKDALSKAQAMIQHLRSMKPLLERMRRRAAWIEQWSQEAKQKVQERKKKREEGRDIAPGVEQTKIVEKTVKAEEQLVHMIEQSRKNTRKMTERLKNINLHLNDIKEIYLKIASKGISLEKNLKKEKKLIERIICITEYVPGTAQDTCDQQCEANTLPEDSVQAEVRAGQIAKQEMEAYTQAKKNAEDALCSLREISAEYSKVEEISERVMNDFVDLLEGSLPFERDVLDHAITGAKNIIKVSINLLKAEGRAKEAAYQTASSRETEADANTARLVANEQEALLLAALANDAFAAYSHLYCIFHTLAVYVIREQLEATLQTSAERLVDAWQAIKQCLGEMKRQQKSKLKERQLMAQSDAEQKVHLLINEQTGVITLRGSQVTAFRLQDLAHVGEASGQEHSGQSRLWFKNEFPCSSYDVSHEFVYEGCQARTRIHLQASDGTEGQGAMLALPNGTHIMLANIDLVQTTAASAGPERGVTITLLKKDERSSKEIRQINLLAAAHVMKERLAYATLQELMEGDFNRSLHRLASAVEAQDIDASEEAFYGMKYNNSCKIQIEKYILSSEEKEKRQKDLMRWMEDVGQATSRLVDTLYEYVNGVLSEEQGEKEITEALLMEQALSGEKPDELFQKRADCLVQIARARGFDTIIACQLLNDPDDASAGSLLSPTIQEVIMEYERATLWRQTQQLQEQEASGSSDKWARYLVQLRRAILEEAPELFRVQLLFSQIKEAVEADRWQEGTAENPGVMHLANELQAGPSAVAGQDHHGSNDYASTLHTLTEHAVVGIQDALTTENPSEVLSRISFLNLAFSKLSRAETIVWQALDPRTPTALARDVIVQIGASAGNSPSSEGTLHHVV